MAGRDRVNDGTWPAERPCDHVQILLGAYVLGGLSEGEESSVRAHLNRCPQCCAEHRELAAVPGWLDLLDDDEGLAGPPER